MSKKYSLAELATLTRARLVGNPDHCISNVDALDAACEEDASFLANPRYKELMKSSLAGVICVHEEVTDLPPQKNFLVSDNPSRTFQTIIETVMRTNTTTTGFIGIHPTAVIHPEAEIAEDAAVGPYAVVDRGAVIGPRTRLMAHTYVGAGSKIGEDCLLYPHAIVREGCVLGKRVVLQPGAVIGSCGFGFTTDAHGRHRKLEQVGHVILEDDVEIGANTTIDRARFKATRIAQGTKIDNLVQIGHNVELGKDNIIVSQTGISGSTKTGRNVVLGGQVGVVGHIEIGDNILVAARGGVSKDLKAPGKYNGTPVMPLAEFNRQQVHLRNISTYVKQIQALEERLSKLEEMLNAKCEMEERKFASESPKD